MKELITRTFPMAEYRKNHTDKLNDLLDFWVFHIVNLSQFGKVNTTLEILNFLKKEGVDLKKISETTKHAKVRIFLKEQGLLN